MWFRWELESLWLYIMYYYCEIVVVVCIIYLFQLFHLEKKWRIIVRVFALCVHTYCVTQAVGSCRHILCLRFYTIFKEAKQLQQPFQNIFPLFYFLFMISMTVLMKEMVTRMR